MNKWVVSHCQIIRSCQIDGYAVASCSFENGRGDDLIFATHQSCIPPPKRYVAKRPMDVGPDAPGVIGALD
jgi:hypothetical protein